MWSRMPVCARPVRTLPRSVFNVSTDLCIFCSAVFLTSAIIERSSNALVAGCGTHRTSKRAARQTNARRAVAVDSAMDERALVLAHHDAFQCARGEDGEHLEQHVLVAAQGEGGGVHDLEVLHDRLVERELRIALGARILLRIG